MAETLRATSMSRVLWSCWIWTTILTRYLHLHSCEAAYPELAADLRNRLRQANLTPHD